MKKEIFHKGFKIIIEILFNQNVSWNVHEFYTRWGLKHKITVSVAETEFKESAIIPISYTKEQILETWFLLENNAIEFINSKKEPEKDLTKFFLDKGFTFV